MEDVEKITAANVQKPYSSGKVRKKLMSFRKIGKDTEFTRTSLKNIHMQDPEVDIAPAKKRNEFTAQKATKEGEGAPARVSQCSNKQGKLEKKGNIPAFHSQGSLMDVDLKGSKVFPKVEGCDAVDREPVVVDSAKVGVIFRSKLVNLGCATVSAKMEDMEKITAANVQKPYSSGKVRKKLMSFRKIGKDTEFTRTSLNDIQMQDPEVDITPAKKHNEFTAQKATKEVEGAPARVSQCSNKQGKLEKKGDIPVFHSQGSPMDVDLKGSKVSLKVEGCDAVDREPVMVDSAKVGVIFRSKLVNLGCTTVSAKMEDVERITAANVQKSYSSGKVRKKLMSFRKIGKDTEFTRTSLNDIHMQDPEVDIAPAKKRNEFTAQKATKEVEGAPARVSQCSNKQRKLEKKGNIPAFHSQGSPMDVDLKGSKVSLKVEGCDAVDREPVMVDSAKGRSISMGEKGNCAEKMAMPKILEKILKNEPVKSKAEDKPYNRIECETCFKARSNSYDELVVDATKLIAPLQLEHSYPHECNDCEKRFIQRKDLQEHLEIHKDDKPYVCVECGERFRWQSHLDKHLHNHVKEKWYPCNQCDSTFNRRSLLDKHLEKHRFVWCVQNVDRELEPHVKKEGFQCDECERTFSDKSQLVEHQQEHTHGKLYSCSVCRKEFSHQTDMVTHQLTHKEENYIQPSKSAKTASKTPFYILHHKVVPAHTSESEASLPPSQPDLAGEEVHECNICRQMFRKKTELSEFLEAGMDEKPYECSECGQRMKWFCLLSKHVLTHRKDTWLQCSECDKSFSQRSRLLKHQKQHIREQNVQDPSLVCDTCGKKFLHKKALDAHRQTHAGYVCKECGKVFLWQSHLGRHLRTHVKGKWSQCKECNNTFDRCSCQLTDQEVRRREKLWHERSLQIEKEFNDLERSLKVATYESTAKEEGNFICTECGLSFTGSSFALHCRSHLSQK